MDEAQARRNRLKALKERSSAAAVSTDDGNPGEVPGGGALHTAHRSLDTCLLNTSQHEDAHAAPTRCPSLDQSRHLPAYPINGQGFIKSANKLALAYTGASGLANPLVDEAEGNEETPSSSKTFTFYRWSNRTVEQ